MLIKKKTQPCFWYFVVGLFLLAITFYLLGFSNKKCIKYSYLENNNVDYKVYLKENNFFEKDYLPKGKTYITSLIDYVDVDFDYNVNFNKNVYGSLNYKIVGIISAEKTNNQVGTYWEKEYDLTDVKTVQVNNQRNVNIKENLKVDYQKYNELLTSFVETYKLSSDGFFKVILKVDGNPQVSKNVELPVSSELSLKIPLSKVAVEASINEVSNNNNKEITQNIEDYDSKYLFYKILFLLDILLLIYLLFKYFYNKARNRKLQSYDSNIKKILNDYSSIMVRVNSLNLKDLNKIKVSSFDDLLVVYNDIRTPINYVEKKHSAEFIIIFEKMAWVYTILEEDYEDYEEDI